MSRLLSAAAIAGFGAIFPAPSAAQSVAPSGGVDAELAADSSTLKKPTGAPAVKSAGGESRGATRSDTRLSDEAELSRVAGLYEAGKYRECSIEIERLLDSTGHASLRQPLLVESARVYWAACLLGAGDSDSADGPLRAAIHENPQMKPPDSLVFPQPVIERFLKVRDSLITEIRAAEQTRILQAQAEARLRQQALERDRERLRTLEKLAQQQTITFKNRRWLAAIPFGVGQFQNREPALGYALLASEAVFASLSLTAIIIQSRMQTQAFELRLEGKSVVDEGRQQQNQRTWGVVKTGSFWAFAALAAGGIVHAQLRFVPEFRSRITRPTPPGDASPLPRPSEVSATPYFDPTGGGLTLQGRF